MSLFSLNRKLTAFWPIYGMSAAELFQRRQLTFWIHLEIVRKIADSIKELTKALQNNQCSILQIQYRKGHSSVLGYFAL